MGDNTELLLGIALVGILVLACLSITTLSQIALGSGGTGTQPLRQTPNQYFGS
jgi:hypothetical protein